MFRVQTRPQPSLRLRPMYVHISSEQLMSFTLLGIQFGVDGMFPLAPPCLLHLLPLLRGVPGFTCRDAELQAPPAGRRLYWQPVGPTERRRTLPTSPYLELGGSLEAAAAAASDWAIMLRSFLILSTLD